MLKIAFTATIAVAGATNTAIKKKKVLTAIHPNAISLITAPSAWKLIRKLIPAIRKVFTSLSEILISPTIIPITASTNTAH